MAGERTPSRRPLPLVAGTGGVHALADPAATGAQRYYRVRRW